MLISTEIHPNSKIIEEMLQIVSNFKLFSKVLFCRCNASLFIVDNNLSSYEILELYKMSYRTSKIYHQTHFLTEHSV